MIWSFDAFGERVAVVQENQREISYQELGFASRALAAKIPHRSLVLCLCTNSFGSLLGYVSFLESRVVPFLVEANLNQALLKQLIHTYRPDYLWCPSDMVARFSSCQNIYTMSGYALLKRKPEDEVAPLHQDLALLLTTSGSTGSPKLVRLSYKNIKSNTGAIVKSLGLDGHDRTVTTLPMSYTYGLSILNTHLFVGGTLLLSDKTMMQREFWQQLKRFGATSLAGVPYTYAMLERLRFSRMALPSLRMLTQAGGKLSTDLHTKFASDAEKKGVRFVVMYGQTEATARMATLDPESTLKKVGSIGKAIPGGRFSLIDAEGQEIHKHGVVGELVYRGENVSLGYARSREDLAKGDERNGLLATGDLAKRDQEGFYYIEGRKRRFLKVFGNRIHLDEVERLLRRGFPHVDFACGGTDDQLIIFLTCPGLRKEISDYLHQQMGINPIAFRFFEIEEIPVSPSGKTRYAHLEELAQANLSRHA